MGPESYKHRGEQGYYPAHQWYLDEFETEKLLEVLKKNEIRESQLSEIVGSIKNRLSLLEIKDKTELTGQEENEINAIKEAWELIRPYIKVSSSQAKDLGETIH